MNASMSKNIRCLITVILLSLTFLSLTQIVTAEKDDVVLEFFYTDTCPLCNQTKPLINNIETDYNESITVKRYLAVKNVTLENYTYFHDHYGFRHVPAVVVLNQTNQTLFTYSQIKFIKV